MIRFGWQWGERANTPDENDSAMHARPHNIWRIFAPRINYGTTQTTRKPNLQNKQQNQQNSPMKKDNDVDAKKKNKDHGGAKPLEIGDDRRNVLSGVRLVWGKVVGGCWLHHGHGHFFSSSDACNFWRRWAGRTLVPASQREASGTKRPPCPLTNHV